MKFAYHCRFERITADHDPQIPRGRNNISVTDMRPRLTMLIPTKTKSSQSVTLLEPLEDKGTCTPRAGTTYVPVVSLEYSLPGPTGLSRLPPAATLTSSQSLTTGRLRLHRSPNSQRINHHMRNSLTGMSHPRTMFFFPAIITQSSANSTMSRTNLDIT